MAAVDATKLGLIPVPFGHGDTARIKAKDTADALIPCHSLRLFNQYCHAD